MISRIKHALSEYPGQFWLLVGAAFIDMLGGFLIFPFFSLYLTEKFTAGLAEVGVVYGIWSLSGLVGRTLGGALADQVGRKVMLIAGLVFSALSSVALALITSFSWIYLAAAVGGLFSSAGGPAQQAMVADVLPEKKYNDGYGILRVVSNLAFAVGPAIGGLLASVSYTLLFLLDAATSILAALFVARFLVESRPEVQDSQAPALGFGSSLRGYLVALRDWRLVGIILLGGLVGLVYFQWYFAVPVFMRDVHGFPPTVYGSLMGFAGVLVVLFQLPITRSMKRIAPMVMMAAGAGVFALGFGMFTFISTLFGFIAAFSVITLGEMVYFPTQQSIVAQLAPVDMRGRYMAIAGLAFSIPNILGPGLGGLLLELANPFTLWYVGAAACLAAAAGFGAFRGRLRLEPDDIVSVALET